jgi:hypothetical protein
MFDHKNLETGISVKVIAGTFEDTGIVLGLASTGIIDCYIVQLDHPLYMSVGDGNR